VPLPSVWVSAAVLWFQNEGAFSLGGPPGDYHCRDYSGLTLAEECRSPRRKGTIAATSCLLWNHKARTESLAKTKGENCLTSWSRDIHDFEFHLDGLSRCIGFSVAWHGSAWSMRDKGVGHQS
jgi:hypothetical protein